MLNLGELDDKFEYRDIINMPRLRECWLLGSVNGLICLEVKENCDDALHIWNPITREYIILPGDKCDKLSIHGFGFVEASNQYKVVTLYLGRNKSECKIFTLGTGMWRSLGHLPFFENGLQDGRVDAGSWGGTWFGTFFAGKLHWLANQKNNNNEVVYTFDLEKELFQITDSAPQVDSDLTTCRSLGTLGGYLCICDSTPDADLVAIWMMKINWTKEIVNESTPGLYFVQPLDILKDRTILLSSCDYCLYTYHLDYKTLQPREDVIADGLQTPFLDTYNAIVYVPSFVRLKSFKEEKVHRFSSEFGLVLSAK